MAIEIRWTVSLSASCVYAANVLRQGRPLADARLAEAVTEPARHLIAEIDAAGLADDRLWKHLLPLSARIENNRQLVETTLKKAVGPNHSNGSSVGRLAGCIADLELAVSKAMPEILDDVSVGAPHLMEPWNIRGDALLRSIGRLTDERLVVTGAEVSFVYPAERGGGLAALLHNSAMVEAIAADPVAELPEWLRLTWLISQLNIDIPIFSENIGIAHRPLFAFLAMLPPTLAAAERIELARCNLETIDLALQTWRVVGTPQVNMAELLLNWWETYESSKPAWNVALAALEQMVWPR